MKGLYSALKKAGREPLAGVLHPESAEPVVFLDPDRTESVPPPQGACQIEPNLPAVRVELTPGEPITKVRTQQVVIPAGSPLLPFKFTGRDLRVGEEYRIIRTKLVQHPAQPRLMVISSGCSGDGKTLNAINLAGALALKTDRKVLLVDGDLRRAGVTRALGIRESFGLVEVLSNICRLEDAIVRLGCSPSFYLLPAGRPCSNPAELLESNRWRILCAELREQFRFTIVDAPPIAAVADYDLLQAYCDGVILIMRVDYSNRAICRAVLQAVPREKVLGVIINCPDDWFMRKSMNYGYYVGEGRTP